jgi:hypothetical protein
MESNYSVQRLFNPEIADNILLTAQCYVTCEYFSTERRSFNSSLGKTEIEPRNNFENFELFIYEYIFYITLLIRFVQMC